MPMMTDPMHVLPAAVEAAQRTASEIVAEAIRAAERAGYERGRAEQRAHTDGDAGLLTLLRRAEAALLDVERSGTSIDGYCDELTVAAKRRGRRHEGVTVPDDTDGFDDVAKFLSDYGGKTLVDPDEIEVDADEVRNVGTALAGECQVLRELLDEAIERLSGEQAPAADSDEINETEDERQTRLGTR
jgi:hypothetical protein